MPTIPQLPSATTVSSADELPVSQSGTTRNVAIGTLLASTQPVISIPTGSLLGRNSLGAGGPEAVALGTGLNLASGTVGATGADHTTFPLQPTLTLTDELVINSGGTPHRMVVGNLTGLLATSITNAAPATALAPTDLVGISQGGSDHAIPFANMISGANVSTARAMATPGLVGYAIQDIVARRLDVRDFASGMFSGASSQNDSVGIQAAINYVQTNGGGIVQLPSTGLVTGQLATPLLISKSGVCLWGQTRSILTHDNLGPFPDCAVKLRWVGATGATMLRVAPPVNVTTGIPVSGCDIRGFLLDANGIAAVGAAFATVQHSFIDLMVTEATADGVLLDTVDIGEFNDCQNNEFTLAVRILTTTGNCVRLAGTARANQLGNSSYNNFRNITLTHNAGDALVFDYADGNWFDKALIQNRPSFTTTTGTAGAGRAVVFKGSSEIVSRSSGNVTLFGGNNNVINQLSCSAPICSLGTPSGYTTPASENRILRFDVGNNPLNVVTEAGANIQISTTENIDLALGASQPSFANTEAQALKLRGERGGEAVAISSTTGDHVGIYLYDTRLWGWGVDGVTNDFRIAANNNTQGQINLGNGQAAYSLNAFGIGTRLPSNTPPGTLYLTDTGTNTVPNPASGVALYVRNGALVTQSSTGVVSPIVPPGRRTVTTASDTPTLGDDDGTIAYTSATAVTVSVADLGSLRSYRVLQLGAGTLTLVPASGVTMSVAGKTVASAVAAFRGAAVFVTCSGSGTVYVTGNTQ